MLIDLKGSEVIIADGDATNVKTVKFNNGNFTWTEKKPTEIVTSRGKLRAGGERVAEVRLGDEQPIDFSFSGMFDVADMGFVDVLKGKPDANGNPTYESASPDGACGPYMFDMYLKFDPATIYGSACTTEAITYSFKPCIVTSMQFSVKDSTITVSGQCFATVHGTDSAPELPA